MSDELTQSFSLPGADSDQFARLSGDFNPLHVDAVYARRTQFGMPVVHGIHLLLKALDAAVEIGMVRPARVRALSVTFSSPVFRDAIVRLKIRSDGGGRVSINAASAGRAAFSAQIEQGEAAAERAAQDSGCPPFDPSQPESVAFPDGVTAGDAGSSPLWVNRDLAKAAFAHLLSEPAGTQLVGELCATTRIVGMKCPGLHSIFGGLKLQRRSAGTPSADWMDFRVLRVDPRFRLLRLAVQGMAFEGTIEAFFRPPPVVQRRLAEVIPCVADGLFAGQKALVVGGSRGLGELTAKILLAGRAQVTVTYARGDAEARQLCQEARTLGRACECMALDVREPLDDTTAAALRRGGYTHVYYFASPRIVKGPATGWDDGLFRQFAQFYLDGLARVSQAVAASAGDDCRPNLFVPSTVFIDFGEPGFAEYCAAKAAAEALCGQLARRYSSRFAAPRLPRMRTDQTVGLTDAGGEDPLPILQRAVAEFCAPP